MSVLLGQQRRIRELEQKLKAMQPDLAYASTIQEPKEIDLAEPKITIPATTGRSGQTQLNIEYIANFDLIKTDSKRIELSQPMFVVAFKHPQQFIFFKLQYSI